MEWISGDCWFLLKSEIGEGDEGQTFELGEHKAIGAAWGGKTSKLTKENIF